MTRSDGQVTLVLGCHRSGTSALTSSLSQMGLALGFRDSFRDVHNPRGYFEDPAFRQLDDQVLTTVGARWDHWAFHPSQVDWAGEKMAEIESRAVQLVTARYGDAGDYVLKDPRMSVLLPFWARVFAQTGHGIRSIVVLRDPREVVVSLMRRFGTGPEYRLFDTPEPAFALWLMNNHALLTTLPSSEAIVVQHSALMARPKQTLARLADLLDLPAPEGLANQSIDPSLHRARPNSEQGSGPWKRLALRLFARLCDGQGDVACRAAADLAKVANADADLMDALPLLAAMQETQAAFDRNLKSIAERRAELAILRRGLWALGGMISDAIPRRSLAHAEESLSQFIDPETPDPAIGIQAARLLIALKRRDEAAVLLRRLIEKNVAVKVATDLLAKLTASSDL